MSEERKNGVAVIADGDDVVVSDDDDKVVVAHDDNGLDRVFRRRGTDLQRLRPCLLHPSRAGEAPAEEEALGVRETGEIKNDSRQRKDILRSW